MKKQPRTELPKDVESMTIEWEVSPYESATRLINLCPSGWQFFSIDRKDTQATVTYIRRIKDNEMISDSVYCPIDEPYWNSKREQVERSLDCIMGKIRTPGLRSELQRYINALMNRANHPVDYIQEAVDDARHDLLMLSGLISNGVDDDES